ncbi:hypothetical protein [Bacillus alkalicellulosilyticus]|uniref:hypothetical protein n=1 Tax=Alkalihalobacterium alkalicellulosilyticum TaxID=1912214 RepID=UPI0009980034|nr:hypothetical protein [Bacillus alkalicellulosilyticus]
MKKPSSGFTPIGFSKAGFSACSFFEECNYGRLDCHYSQIDTEVKNYCNCYLKHHSSLGKVVEKSEEIQISSLPKDKKVNVPTEVTVLSLF